MDDNNSDIVGSAIASKFGMVGGFMASLYGYLSTTEAVVFIGLIVTVVGFFTNHHFQKKRHIRETKSKEIENKLNCAKLEAIQEETRMKREMHEAKMKALLGEKVA